MVGPGTAWGIGIFLMLAYETYSLLNKKPGDTLSEAVWNVATKRPLIPFLVGFLMGHLFWQGVR